MSASPNFKQLIDKCTADNLQGEDWDAIVSIGDVLCQRPDEVTPVAVQCMLQRASVPKPNVQLNAITLIDFCVKNTTELFNRTLVKPNNIIIVENLAKSPNTQVAKRTREVLAEWSRDYGTKIPQFAAVNAKFTSTPSPRPVTPAAASAIVPSAPPAMSPVQQQQPQQQPRPIVQQQQQQAPIANNKPAKNKKEKLKQDLDAVRDTIELLLDMVTVASHVSELKNQTVYEIVANCKEMHRRVIQLIERVPEEEILLELLQVNDELADAIDYYEVFKKTNVKRDKAPAKPVRSAVKNQYVADPIVKNSNAPDMFLDQQQPEVPLLAPPPQVSRPVAAKSSNSNQLFSIDDLLGGSSSTAAAPQVPAVQPMAPIIQPNSLNPFEDPILQNHRPVSEQYYEPQAPPQQPYYAQPSPYYGMQQAAPPQQQPYYNLQAQQPMYPNPLVQQEQAPMDPFELVIADPAVPARQQSPQRPAVAQQSQPQAQDAFLLPPPKSDQQTKKRGANNPTAAPANNKPSVASDFENFLNSVSNTSNQQQQQGSSSNSNKSNQLFSLE